MTALVPCMSCGQATPERIARYDSRPAIYQLCDKCQVLVDVRTACIQAAVARAKPSSYESEPATIIKNADLFFNWITKGIRY